MTFQSRAGFSLRRDRIRAPYEYIDDCFNPVLGFLFVATFSPQIQSPVFQPVSIPCWVFSSSRL